MLKKIAYIIRLLCWLHWKQPKASGCLVYVAVMKLFAICKRGTRKDFYDVWVLLKYFSKDELMALFIKKYGEGKVIFWKRVFFILRMLMNLNNRKY